jgi:hypothetical protein
VAIYQREQFVIVAVANGFIAINTKKENWKDSHTHLHSFNAAKTAIDLVIKKKIPKEKSFYYLRSLMRLSDDEKYVEEIKNLIEVKKSKGKKLSYNNKQ